MTDIVRSMAADIATLEVGTSERIWRRLDRGELVVARQSQPPGLRLDAVAACTPERMWHLLGDFESLPAHIPALRTARVLRQRDGEAEVRFTMKLPFPVGQLSWTNRIKTRQYGQSFGIAWELVEGDLQANSGRLLLAPYRGHPARTHARYQVQVETRSRLPRSAQRLATGWLLPKVIARLRDIAER